MTLLVLFAIVTATTFIWRLVGLTVPVAHTSAFWERFLRFVPISVFTALIISALYNVPELLNLKIIALLVAGIVAVRTRQFGVSVLVGMAALWIIVGLDIR